MSERLKPKCEVLASARRRVERYSLILDALKTPGVTLKVEVDGKTIPAPAMSDPALTTALCGVVERAKAFDERVVVSTQGDSSSE